MQHVLAELWKGMRDRILTHDAYEQLGELEGALDRHAEAVFARLTKEEQGLARRLFSRLLNVEEDGEVTRRVASRQDIGEELWSLASRLAGEGSRLLTLRGAQARALAASRRAIRLQVLPRRRSRMRRCYAIGSGFKNGLARISSSTGGVDGLKDRCGTIRIFRLVVRWKRRSDGWRCGRTISIKSSKPISEHRNRNISKTSRRKRSRDAG